MIKTPSTKIKTKLSKKRLSELIEQSHEKADKTSSPIISTSNNNDKMYSSKKSKIGYNSNLNNKAKSYNFNVIEENNESQTITVNNQANELVKIPVVKMNKLERLNKRVFKTIKENNSISKDIHRHNDNSSSTMSSTFSNIFSNKNSKSSMNSGNNLIGINLNNIGISGLNNGVNDGNNIYDNYRKYSNNSNLNNNIKKSSFNQIHSNININNNTINNNTISNNSGINNSQNNGNKASNVNNSNITNMFKQKQSVHHTIDCSPIPNKAVISNKEELNKALSKTSKGNIINTIRGKINNNTINNISNSDITKKLKLVDLKSSFNNKNIDLKKSANNFHPLSLSSFNVVSNSKATNSQNKSIDESNSKLSNNNNNNNKVTFSKLTIKDLNLKNSFNNIDNEAKEALIANSPFIKGHNKNNTEDYSGNNFNNNTINNFDFNTNTNNNSNNTRSSKFLFSKFNENNNSNKNVASKLKPSSRSVFNPYLSSSNNNNNNKEIIDNLKKKKINIKSKLTSLNNPLKDIYNNNSSNNNNNNNDNLTNTNSNINTDNIIKQKSISCISYKSLPGRVNAYQTKINQDSFLIITNVFGFTGFSIFGVFDGHGSNGHLVSDFCKKYFETFFTNKDNYSSNYNNNNSSEFTKESIYKCMIDKDYSLLFNAFTSCEKALSKNNSFDVNMSGTTCVVVINIDQHILCANAGDSRAILSTKEGIKNLSFDHKPEKNEEKNRIIKNGGKIHPIKEGNRFIGPSRVWVKSGEFPGLAMSRSLGDFLAKSVGCTCAPEIVETRVTDNTKFLVLASDGIFEVLDNNQVDNSLQFSFMEKKFELSAGMLVDRAVQQWRKLSTGQDDITAIIAFFES